MKPCSPNEPATDRQESRPENSPLDGRPCFCCLPKGSTGRNAFAWFFLDCQIDGTVREGVLHLFADTRFRLWVNGRVVGYGPPRFHPAFPEFSSFDLRECLVEGPNRLAVEVWSAGSPNFQSVEAPGVFWADGFVRTEILLSLASPGHWKSVSSSAREVNAVLWSFAIGPVEILDYGRWQEEKFSDGNPLRLESHPSHGQPVPSSIPGFETKTHLPVRVLAQGPGSTGNEIRLGAFRHFEGYEPWRQPREERDCCYATWIFSPSAREIEAGIFWGAHFLNGREVQAKDVPSLSNRQNVTLSLEAGWNLLAGRFAVYLDVWGMPLGLPAGVGLKISPFPEEGHAPGFLLSPPLLGGDEGPDLQRLGLSDVRDWERVSADSLGLAPSREVGWDRLISRCEPRAFVDGEVFELDSGPDGLAMLTLEFRQEFYGRPELTVTAESHCTVDVSCDEFLRPDGTLDIFRGFFGVHSTDQYMLPPGSHHLSAFHSRGGRFLQFNVRTRPASKIRLANIAVAESKTPFKNTGEFSCDNEFWNWAWEASRRTLHASLEDIWSDSPWREQGCYLGDSLVQFHAQSCLSADMRLAARILRLWTQCQRPDGQMPAVMPAAMTLAHEDFSLHFVRFLGDYWDHTGDDETVRYVWPAIQRILKSETWFTGPQGLMAARDSHYFIDWSVEPEARLGFSSVINALFLVALRTAAQLAPVAGASPREWEEKYSELHRAFSEHLWNEEEGHLLTSIDEAGNAASGRALHANSFAWASGLFPPKREARVLTFLLGELHDNAGKIIRKRESQEAHPRSVSGQIEPFFLFFFLDALAARGHAKAAESILLDTWGTMKNRGAVTLWESIVQSYFNDGSLCHSWAAYPMIYASRRILGVTRPKPGRPGFVRIQPLAEGVNAARGVVPHPLGPITVSWTRREGEFHMNVDHPEGLDVTCCAPPGAQTAFLTVNGSLQQA